MPFVTEFWLDRVACLSASFRFRILASLSSARPRRACRFVYRGKCDGREGRCRANGVGARPDGTRHHGRDRNGAERSSDWPLGRGHPACGPGTRHDRDRVGERRIRTYRQESIDYRESQRAGQGWSEAGRHQGAGKDIGQDGANGKGGQGRCDPGPEQVGREQGVDPGLSVQAVPHFPSEVRPCEGPWFERRSKRQDLFQR